MNVPRSKKHARSDEKTTSMVKRGRVDVASIMVSQRFVTATSAIVKPVPSSPEACRSVAYPNSP